MSSATGPEAAGSTAAELRELLEFATDDERPVLRAEIERLESIEAGETVAKTIAEAAALLGVSDRQVARWLLEPGFPGRSGDAGQRNGFFPIGRIVAWRAARGDLRSRGDAVDHELKRRKLAAETKTTEAQLRAMVDGLISKSQADEITQAAVESAETILSGFPARVVASIPEKRRRLRAMIQREAERLVCDVMRTLRDGLTAREDDEHDRPVSLPGGPAGAHSTVATSQESVDGRRLP